MGNEPMRQWLLVMGVLLACRPAAPSEPVLAVDTPAPAPAPAPKPAPAPAPRAALDVDLAERLERAPEPASPPEGWPAALPWVSEAGLRYATCQASEAGDVRVRWSAPSTQLEELATRLLPALAGAGYAATESCELRPGSACRLQLADRMASLSAGVSYPGSDSATVELHLYPAGHRPLARLPGKCVVPPPRRHTVLVSASGIDQEGESRYAKSQVAVESSPGPDLDGDGEAEVYVPHASKQPCPWDVPHDVYVMRGSCGHRVGTIVGPVADQTTIAPFVHGLRTIHTTAEWSAYDGDWPEPNHHTRTRRYEFDGTKLRKRADEEREGKCHHCGVVHCVRE